MLIELIGELFTTLTADVRGLGFKMDQERERLRQQEVAKKVTEEAEEELRKKRDEEAARHAIQETAEREAALEQRRLEKAMALGVEPEKGPDVTQVCILSLAPASLLNFLCIEFMYVKFSKFLYQ